MSTGSETTKATVIDAFLHQAACSNPIQLLSLYTYIIQTSYSYYR